eukprot:TRINITY_DN693_c0_g1_i1.p1 TRINITY_DN693_c0_g1~~TRINITY_DN693_c0_g1_i1.p1  ORF type:complete len:175 (-),score=59.86 TRINITY_DN693_c0_g1_i1:412-936(-)
MRWLGFFDWKKVDVTKFEAEYTSIVYPWDLDLNIHMNNARYLENSDHARVGFFVQTGFFKQLWKLNGTTLIASSTTRYRRELKPFQMYSIFTKIIGWNETSVFVRQQFRVEENVHCTIVFRMPLINTKSPKERINPETLFESMPGVGKVETPSQEELETFLENYGGVEGALHGL